MILSDSIKQSILNEYSSWKDSQYAGKNKDWQQQMGAFYTPPELTIQMLEKFDNLNGTILDPTCGCGGLLAACILAGADPKKCYGIELDPDILEICRERLSHLGVPKYNLHLGNALNDDCYDHFDESYSYDVKNDKVLINGKAPKQIFDFGYSKYR